MAIELWPDEREEGDMAIEHGWGSSDGCAITAAVLACWEDGGRVNFL